MENGHSESIRNCVQSLMTGNLSTSHPLQSAVWLDGAVGSNFLFNAQSNDSFLTQFLQSQIGEETEIEETTLDIDCYDGILMDDDIYPHNEGGLTSLSEAMMFGNDMAMVMNDFKPTTHIVQAQPLKDSDVDRRNIVQPTTPATADRRDAPKSKVNPFKSAKQQFVAEVSVRADLI